MNTQPPFNYDAFKSDFKKDTTLDAETNQVAYLLYYQLRNSKSILDVEVELHNKIAQLNSIIERDLAIRSATKLG